MKKHLLLIALFFTFSSSFAQIQGYAVGDTVADFTITTIEGEEINLYTITAGGQYVYIDFFFVDCGPCQATAPHFNQLHETYGCNEGDIFCMSVNNGNDDDAYVESYETTYGGDYAPCPIASNEGDAGAVDSDFNPAAYPTICLISPNNILLNNDIWPISSYTDFVDALTDEGFTPDVMECSVVGIEEETQQTSFSFYPNPANDFITIELDDKSVTIKKLEIFNASGHLVFENSKNTTSSIKIDVSDFENGLYIANIYDHENTRSTLRFNVIK